MAHKSRKPVVAQFELPALASRHPPGHIRIMAEKHPHKPNDAKALARWNNEGGAPASGDVSTRKLPKRPRDLNQWAKHMVDLATMDEDERRELEKRREAKSEKADKPRQSPGKRGPSG